jgi:hypothetical protein
MRPSPACGFGVLTSVGEFNENGINEKQTGNKHTCLAFPFSAPQFRLHVPFYVYAIGWHNAQQGAVAQGTRS